jgi:hypothetical protein
MRGVFAVAMIPVAMVFNHVSTRCRYLMLMLNAYHHAGNNQRQPKKDWYCSFQNVRYCSHISAKFFLPIKYEKSSITAKKFFKST